MTPAEELSAAAQKIRDNAEQAASCQWSQDAVETIANLWLNNTHLIADLLEAIAGDYAESPPIVQDSIASQAPEIKLARAINNHWLFQP